MKFQVGDRVYVNVGSNVYYGTVIESSVDDAFDQIVYVNWDNADHPFVPNPLLGASRGCPHFARVLTLISPLKQLAECGE